MCRVYASGFFYTATAISYDLLLSLLADDSRPSIIIYAGAGLSSSDISYIDRKQAKIRAMMGWVHTHIIPIIKIVCRLDQ